MRSFPRVLGALASLGVYVLGACGQSTSVPASGALLDASSDATSRSSPDASSEPDAATPDAAPQPSDAAGDAWGATSLTRLPIGDGRYVQYPQSGYVFSCQATISGGGGSQVEGPWIKSDGTFDFTAKLVVQGAVSWPSHTFATSLDDAGVTRTVEGNNLPDHATGTFPIATSDPAHAYDGNPNTISAQTIQWSLPATPTVAQSPTCLDGGPIGILLTGAVLFDALDGEGRDAVAHEEQDACQAHPQDKGEYHYHWASTCAADPGTGHSALVGYARDGFGIYGARGESGAILTDADLDECHGHTHAITWNGQTVTMYHYHATYEYPYTLGCFRGTPVVG